MSRAPRVAMVAACPFPLHRGSPIRVQRLAGALVELGVEVEVVTYHLGRRQLPLPHPIHRIPRVPTYRTEDPGPRFQKLALLDPLLARELRRVLARQRFDLIHAHHYEGLAVALASAPRKTRLPVLYDAHTLLESELPTYLPRPLQPLARRLGAVIDRSLPPRADRVVAVSEQIRSQLVQSAGIAPDRVDVIASGVEPDLFPRRREAPPPGRAPVIVYAGGLAPFHGIDLLLRAFRDVARELPEASLWILTDSSFEPYEALARSLGVRSRIRLESARLDGLARRLAQADVAVNPRVDCDGVPQKLLNYMAVGLPVASFAGAGAMLTHGETGWLVEDGNVPALARALVRLATDRELALRLGAAAADKGRSLYTWQNAALRMRDVYTALLGSAGDRRPRGAAA